MARGDESSGREDTEEVLSPEELDIATDENVATLGGGRYVVGSDGPPNEDKVEQVRAELVGAVDGLSDGSEPTNRGPDPESTAGHRSDGEPQQSGATEAAGDPVDAGQVRAWIDQQLRTNDSRYAYRIAAKSGDRVSHQQLASDDVGMAFDALLLWYAQQVGDGTAVEEALGILLAESSIRVKYPTRRLLAYLEEHDFDPGDSVADLVRTVRDEGGLVFPAKRRNQD